MDHLTNIIEGLREEMTETLARWIKIPSVKGEAAPGAPFGAEVRRALDVALEDAEKMGFKVRNFDGYAGDVRMGPEGVNPLAILAHLDVVPAGDGWQTDPFGADLIDGKMYGRGTSDDKGPAVAGLYAMYAAKKAGIPLNREIRLILGCDEETGMACMKYYAKHCDMPRSGFSPDANFPVINTEKGLLHLDLGGEYTAEGLRVKEISVGERPNVIPGLASALLEGDESLCEKANQAAKELGLDVKAEMQEGLVKITATGIPGHAAFPAPARNAIGMLLLVLKELGVKGALETLADRVGMQYDGLGLGVKCEDQVSGPLTCNLGILRYSEQNGLYATLDIRYPILCDHKALTASIVAALEPCVQVKVDSQKDPHHVAPNSKLVTALMEAYAEVTGDTEAKPMAIGGGTYAKMLEEGVAFGSLFPDEEELAHQAGEYISIDSLVKNLYIFVKAIEKLQD
ncbi:MAG: dipeptidase PepV [Clostridia bacterium]|nr:dipeptidase PepV [Clostridia bacterium]